MAYYFFCVFSAAVMVWMGLPPCMSETQCTKKTIGRCRWNNMNDRTGCEFYQRSVKCLEDLSPYCVAANLLAFLKSTMVEAKKGVDDCPGLPDGVCYNDILQPCMDHVPAQIIFNPTMPESLKKNACEYYMKNTKDTNTCFAEVKAKCKSERVAKYIKPDMDVLEAVRVRCEGYMNG